MWKDSIKVYYSTMTRVQKKAADYLLQLEEEIEHLTIRNCADGAGVGQPTVLRMIQKCGYESWSMFLQEIWRDNGRNESTLKTALEGKEKYKGRFKAVMQSIDDDMNLISEMASNLDLYVLDDLARMIRHAKMIDIYGSDNSANAATELAGRLLHLGLPSRNYSDLFFQKISAGHLGKRDVAIGFSISGETIAVIQMLQTARQSGAITVAVTGDLESTLAKEADYQFLTPTVYENTAGKWIASRITQMAFVDAICASIISSDKSHYQAELLKSSRGFQEDVSERARSYGAS